MIITWNNMFIEYQPEIKEKRKKRKKKIPIDIHVHVCTVYCIIFNGSKSCTGREGGRGEREKGREGEGKGGRERGGERAC